MGIYDNDGKIKLTSAPGSGFCGAYALDGSWYFTLEPGSGFCGSIAPNGSLYVHNATGEGFGGRYATNGALRVTSANEYNGALRVSGLSSIVASIDFLTTTSIPSWMTFIATGLATQFDSTGKLTYRPNNLLLNTATLGTQTVTVQVGANYILSIKGTGSVTLTGASTAGPLNGTGAANRVDLKITAATSSLTLTVSGSVTSARLSAVTYETAFRSQDDVDNTASAYYGPRIDYDPNTLAVKGLLIEEARTNGVINSTDPAVWAVLGVANTTGVTDPQALTKAATVTAAAGAGYHHTSQTGATASAAQARVISVFVKQGTAPYVNFGASGDASWHVGWMKWSDLSTGSTNGTVSVQACANGYYRLSLAFTMANAATVVPYVGPDVASRAIAPNYTAAGTETVIAWGLQDEPGYFATSYIPTAAASVTRAADVVQFTGAALTALQGSAATFIGQTIGLPFNPAANSALVAATAGNAVIAYVTNSNAVGVAKAATYNGAVALTVGTPNYTTAMRIGSAFSGSGRSLVVNGGSVATDANAIGSRPAVYLGGTGASFYLNGWMQSFAIYNQRLPDATLQSQSVVGATYL